MAQKSCNLDKKEEAEILKPPSSSSSSSSTSPAPFMNSNNNNNSLQEFSSKKPEKPEKKTIRKNNPSKPPPPSVRLGNRCSSCRKRVGLTGFRCRCGDLFCGKHRYSDVHDCSFDYKALGRQEISKANPLIRAAKIIKI